MRTQTLSGVSESKWRTTRIIITPTTISTTELSSSPLPKIQMLDQRAWCPENFLMFYCLTIHLCTMHCTYLRNNDDKRTNLDSMISIEINSSDPLQLYFESCSKRDGDEQPVTK